MFFKLDISLDILINVALIIFAKLQKGIFSFFSKNEEKYFKNLMILTFIQHSKIFFYSLN